MSRMAVVHDWLDGISGAEKVLKEIIRCLPGADVFSLFDHLTDAQRDSLGLGIVRTSFLQRIPFRRGKFCWCVPLMPLAIEQLKLADYEVIVSSNLSFAKGIVTSANQIHLSYIHSPNCVAFDAQAAEFPSPAFSGGLRNAMVQAYQHYLRLWDRCAVDRVDVLVANSQYVARLLKKIYSRNSHVIYPPVDIARFTVSHNKKNYFVAEGPLLPQKRFDLIVTAMRHMPDQKLYLIGDGPEKNRLQKMAGDNVELLGYQPDEIRDDLIQHAKALVIGSIENFGISAVEAQACGTPVVAMGRGGTAETVLHGETGYHFSEQTTEAIADAMQTIAEMPEGFFDADRIRTHAELFSRENFCARLTNLVNELCRQKGVGQPVEVHSLEKTPVIAPALQVSVANEPELAF